VSAFAAKHRLAFESGLVRGSEQGGTTETKRLRLRP